MAITETRASLVGDSESPAVLFRETAERAPASTALPTPEDARIGHDAVLVCALCGTAITSSAERVAVGGAHEHFEVNPHGASFRFGCFGLAVNLLTIGPPQRAWTWFPGYAWQVIVCAGCAAHMGWRFQSETHRFHGLLLDALVEADHGEA